MENNDIYYRILRVGHKLVIVTMQRFDEYDYDQKRFASPDKYATEEEAQAEIDRRYADLFRLVFGE
jgi:hypothetical protein